VPDVGPVVDVPALRHDPVYLLFVVTVASFVLGGFREELWRAAFWRVSATLARYFGGRKGELMAVLVAAVLFGAGHLVQGPIAAVMAGLLGLGWCDHGFPSLALAGGNCSRMFDATS